MSIDHPRLRREHTCPVCQGNKETGLVWCWPCHNTIQGGSAEDRRLAELVLVATEVKLDEVAAAETALRKAVLAA